MATPTVIRLEDVSKRFVIRKEKSLKERLLNPGRSNRHKEDFWALRGVDLEIAAGTTIGLVGPNGSGKSTLLKTIGGIIQPTTGAVSLRGRLAALLELGAGFHPDLTGRENVYLNASILGLSRKITDQYFDAIVDFSGIEQFIDTQVKFYSSGMYVRLAFAVAVHMDPDILLVDEVLAVGDEPFQRKCLERIRRFQVEGRAIILVSHSLDQVAEFADRVVVLEKGKVVADGPPNQALMVLRADFETERQAELARQAAEAPDALAARFTGIAVDQLVIQPDDPLIIAMEVEAFGLGEGWTVEAAITTPLGAVLYSVSSAELNGHLGPLTGVRKLQFRIARLPVVPGDYSVRAMLRSPAGGELHMVPVAARFSVAGDPPVSGHIHASAEFQAF